MLYNFQSNLSKALQVNEGLQSLKTSVVDIEANFVQLSGEIQAAHTDCEHQVNNLAILLMNLLF